MGSLIWGVAGRVVHSWGQDVPTAWSVAGRCAGSCREFLTSHFSTHGYSEASGEQGTRNRERLLASTSHRPVCIGPPLQGWSIGHGVPEVETSGYSRRTPLGFSFLCSVASPPLTSPPLASHLSPLTSPLLHLSTSHPSPRPTLRQTQQGTGNQEQRT